MTTVRISERMEAEQARLDRLAEAALEDEADD
jgi:hypothetical protein